MNELGWKYLTADDKRQILQGIADGVAYGGPYHVEIHPAGRSPLREATRFLRGDGFTLPERLDHLGERLRLFLFRSSTPR